MQTYLFRFTYLFSRVTLDYETTRTILVNDIAYPFKLKDTILGSNVFTENLFPLQCVGVGLL